MQAQTIEEFKGKIVETQLEGSQTDQERYNIWYYISCYGTRTQIY